jgi:hypothetical protein
MPRIVSIACLLIVSSVLALAQAEPAAVLTFVLDFPSSQPEHYSIRIPGDGLAHYESSGRLSAESDSTDSFAFDFVITPRSRQKIFELAARADYFRKDIDSHHKGLAFTGKKMLSYKDAQHSAEATFNYSSLPAVQDLTTLLQNLSATLEFGHRLQYDRRYQKLALDAELKRMEEMAERKQVLEISAIQPILDQLIADPAVMNVTRARAQRLLEVAGTE